MVDIASLAIQIDTSDVARAENDLERLGTKGAKAEQAAKGVGDAYQQAAGKVGGVAGAATQAGTALERNSVAARENARELASVDRTASSLSGSMSKLGATLAGLTAGMSIKGIIDISDNYGQMADRIKMATASTEEYRMVQERLLQSANRTYRPLAEAQELYIRTADAIRSLGYQTSDALDITDSFSYLLVTNAASADKASNAINAYSKSIQSGRIEVDSWQSLIAAMPSVVDTLSGSLGKSAEEIRQLGITGKLSLADLNEGLRQTVEQNQKLADGMGTTLNDAIVRASNNLSTYLGESSKVTASSRLLSGALDGVTENIDLIATTLGGVAVAAVARYATVTAKSTAASVAQTIAAGRQAAEELKLAQAQVASATAAVALARANVGLTASTGQVTAALAAQEAAQKRLAAAQSASVGLGRTVLGLAGGWAGLAVTAGAVALSFVDWGDGAEEAARKSIALREETNLLTRAVEDLDAAQAKQVLQRMEEPYQAAKDEARNYAAQIEYLNAQLDRHPGSAKVEEWNRALVDAKGNLSTVNQELATQEAKMRDLNARIEQNTNAWKVQREAASETDKEGQSFLASLQRRADLSGKLTEVQKTQISIEKGYAGALSETAKQEALAAAATIDRANAALNAGKGVAKATDEQARAFQSLYDSLYPAEAAQREYNEQVRLLKQYLSGDQLAKAIDRLNFAMEGADATGPADAIEEYRKELQRLEDQLDPVGKATKQYQQDVKRLDDALGRGELTIERHAELMAELGRQYDENRGVTSEWAKWTEGALDRVDAAFADAWRNIGDGFSSFRDSLTNAFKQMLAELAHMAITKPIIMQIGSMMGIGGGTQGNNGIWGSLLGGGSSSGGGYGIQDGLSTVSAARNAYSLYSVGLAGMANTWGGYLAGAGNMLGMTGLGNFGIGMQGATLAPGLAGPTTVGASGSMGAGAQVGSSLSGMGGLMANPATWIAAGMLASAKFYDAGYRLDTEDVARQKANKMSFAIDPALSSVLNLGVKTTELATKLLGGGKLANILTGGSLIAGVTGAVDKALFGGAWKTKDYGIGLGVDAGMLDAQQFEYRKKKGGLFSSSKKKTIWTELDPELAAALQETYDATEAGVSDLLARIGVSVTDGAYDGLEIARRQISTKGKTEEEISAAISEWFSFAAGRMIAEIDQGIGGFGYSLEELTQRINVFEGVNDSLELINVAVLDLSAHSMELANGMAEAAGGMDAFSAGISAYYGSFFTAAEQQDKVFASLVETFEEAEQVLAASRQDYRDMVEAIDVTTEAGRNLFNTLMGLATQADAYYDILEARAAEAINAAGAAFGALQSAVGREVAQLQTQYQAAQASANGLLQLSGTLQSALRSMRMESQQFDQMRRTEAQGQLASALELARSGGSLQGLDLSGALTELGRDSTQFYGSFEDYARDYWKTAQDINSLDQLAGKQLSVEEKTLEAIESQISYYDQMLLDAQNELNALMGIDTSVQSVAAALANFKVAVGAAETAKNAAAPKTAKQTIADTYRSVLGRDAGSAELNYWLQRIGEGTATTGNLADLFKTSDEYKSKVPGFASGGFHSGGLRLVGENGPELEVTGPSRIYNASQTAAMLGGGGDAAREVRGLRSDFAGMMDALRSVAKHTMKTAQRVEFLERWDYDGLPEARAV